MMQQHLLLSPLCTEGTQNDMNSTLHFTGYRVPTLSVHGSCGYKQGCGAGAGAGAGPFGPTGAGAVELHRLRLDTDTYFWPEETKADPYVHEAVY